MLQGPLQHIALGAEDWSSQHLRTSRMKHGHTANNMPIPHQEPENMSQPVKISFEPIGWSSACARPTPCATCLFKSPTDGSRDCPECSSNLAKSLRAVSTPPSTPISATKQEPQDPTELLGSAAMAKTVSAMSFDSAYGSTNDGLVGGMVGMGDALHGSPGGYPGYVQTSPMPYSQATSQYGSNEGQFEYNVSMYDPLDACEAVSPMDQSIYPMPSPLMDYSGSPQLESPITFTQWSHRPRRPRQSTCRHSARERGSSAPRAVVEGASADRPISNGTTTTCIPGLTPAERGTHATTRNVHARSPPSAGRTTSVTTCASSTRRTFSDAAAKRLSNGLTTATST
ncbi:hypothetical protein MAPG_05460 [Magnaporthiopsis poae ATCC 64411]|uniref:Uncharacterized protein n=1 Tax=Magnaporthiopsis poae (strain ATCC 64411 / 73-15) TaxID=644358 RepID=A0A0C4DZG0_MAGP6|nr:hypothetical protein MAPG_05460 [Magnaporthiopsis poae ATCC 64411]